MWVVHRVNRKDGELDLKRKAGNRKSGRLASTKITVCKRVW
jgi:hypothetical protein